MSWIIIAKSLKQVYHYFTEIHIQRLHTFHMNKYLVIFKLFEIKLLFYLRQLLMKQKDQLPIFYHKHLDQLSFY